MNEVDPSTEQLILEAARNVFLQKGMSGARMQDIADEAGINKALLHYYFRNKSRLFEMIFREALQKLLVSIKDIVDNDMSLEEKITTICVRYISMLSENPYLPLFVLHEIHQDPRRIIQFFKEKEIEFHLQKFFLQIQDSISHGSIRQVSPPQLMINIISLCVFPFAAGPLIKSIFGIDQWQFQMFVEERKKQVPEFVLAALRPAINNPS
ncbi:MAG: TetR/AcrR family transcriptional regulator [Chitinophagaceae bacterium]|nr:MAG: TetR/AcrR family transcriptional regulator [Chitinophagaceae bacterium]